MGSASHVFANTFPDKLTSGLDAVEYHFPSSLIISNFLFFFFSFYFLIMFFPNRNSSAFISLHRGT